MSDLTVRRADLLWLVAVVLLGWVWLHARDARIRTEALAEAQADSAAAAIAALGARHRERARRREDVERVAALRADTLRQLRAELVRLRSAGAAVGPELLERLDRDSTVGDSLRGLIRFTVTLLNNQAAACDRALTTCDSLLFAKDVTITALDSTVTELRPALTRTHELWQAAERRARPGFFRRLEIALPFMAFIGSVVAVFK